jgi:hypothetical protein
LKFPFVPATQRSCITSYIRRCELDLDAGSFGISDKEVCCSLHRNWQCWSRRQYKGLGQGKRPKLQSFPFIHDRLRLPTTSCPCVSQVSAAERSMEHETTEMSPQRGSAVRRRASHFSRTTHCLRLSSRSRPFVDLTACKHPYLHFAFFS